MCGVRGVTQKHDRRRCGIADPGLVDDAQEVDPRRAAQVTRVGHQTLATEVRAEQPLAKCDRLVRVHAVDARGSPNGLGRLDDERAAHPIEFVGVRLEPAPFGLLERKRERLEYLVRAEPDVAAVATFDLWLKYLLVSGPDDAVDAVTGDDQIGLATHCLVSDLGLEYQPSVALL